MKAIFFDIDGTLIEGRDPKYRYPATEVIAAIKRLQVAGHKVFIATGRGWSYLDSSILNIDFDGYILLNGSVVLYQDELIYHHPLCKADVHTVCTICDHANIQYVLSGAKQSYIQPEFTGQQQRLQQYGISRSAYTTDFNIEDIDVYKFEINSPDIKDKDIIIRQLPATLTYADDPLSNTCAVDVFNRNISKATGIKQVLQQLQIPLSDSYAFGDGNNDIEMLSTVGTGFAMGNATDKAKQAARIVVPSIFDNGVVYGIEHYILTK